MVVLFAPRSPFYLSTLLLHVNNFCAFDARTWDLIFVENGFSESDKGAEGCVGFRLNLLIHNSPARTVLAVDL